MSTIATPSARLWRCLECGDSGWSADRADVEEHLARFGIETDELTPQPVDYCPECYWELVTGLEPTPDVLPSMIGQTFDVDRIPAHSYADDVPDGDAWTRPTHPR